jgi:hypothetical protein
MHVKMTACYLTMKMSCWRNVVFAKHHNTSKMTKISMTRYFPIIPHVRWLFTNKANAKLLQWHTREHKKDAMLHHPTDGIQWRNDRKHMDFAMEVRNIRFGLSTDGMNPFGETYSSHST